MDRDKLILDNIQLIHKVIKDLHIYYETEDEYQEYYDYGLEGLIKAVDKLKNEKDKLVIKMRYGLDGYKEHTYKDIAVKLDVSRNMINLRKNRALKKLKEYLEKNDKEVFMIEQKNIYTSEKNVNKQPKKLTTLNDLNNVLFQQLEALNDEKLDFEKEIRKSYAVSQIAQQIVANTNTCIKAMKLAKEHKIDNNNQLEFIGLTYEK